MAKPDPNLVAIDIGSSKVAVLIAKQQDNGELEIVGKGRASNRGTRKGNIVNIDAAVDAYIARITVDERVQVAITNDHRVAGHGHQSLTVLHRHVFDGNGRHPYLALQVRTRPTQRTGLKGRFCH